MKICAPTCDHGHVLQQRQLPCSGRSFADFDFLFGADPVVGESTITAILSTH